MPTYLTTSEAAQAMGVDIEMVRRLCRQGLMKGAFRKDGQGTWLIPDTTIRDWLDQSSITSAAAASQPQPTQAGGDTISVSGIQDSNVAVGRGASVTVTQGLTGEALTDLFKLIYQKIEARPPDPDVDREEVQATVQNIETEVQKGETANPSKVERWLKTLASIAPDILEVTLATLTNPAVGIATVIRKVAEKAQQEAASP
jgi:excisionase family DNA binding protein